ncbi:MAG: 5'-3' exonuclease H3TH domain-containing protein, partial [Clostridia bacterium]
MGNEKLMVVDGNSILNRAFYGLQGRNLLSTSYGLYTNAVYGFINIISRYIDEESPQYLCVAFDLKAPTFRHLEFEGYKAKRKGMPPELVVQVPVIKEVLDAMNIRRLEYEGYEADDIIGSISLCAERLGLDTVILTGDKDSFQLLSDKTKVKIPVTRAGKTDTEEYDLDRLKEKYGVTPIQFIDVKGLMGDPSDNIPGVPGIGEKTAISLIQEFDSIENLYENISKVERVTVKEKLETNKELAYTSKRLATIERNMPKMCDIHELKRSGFDKDELFKLFKKLEFNNFIEKFNLSPAADLDKTMGNVTNISKKEDIEKLKKDIVKNGWFSFYCPMKRNGNEFYRPVGIGISLDEDKIFYISFNADVSEELFFSEMKDVFEDETIKKTSHDANNLIVYLLSEGIKLAGYNFDTMIAAYIINPSSDTYSLKELAEFYLKKNIESIEELTGKGKNQIAIIDIPNDRLSFIAGIYARTISLLEDVLGKIISENNQKDLYHKIELPLVTVLANMEFEGFKVDRDGLIIFSAELEDRINELTDQIYELS